MSSSPRPIAVVPAPDQAPPITRPAQMLASAAKRQSRRASTFQASVATLVVAGFVANAIAYGMGALTRTAAFLLATLLSYVAFMPFHEAGHGNIAGGQRGLRWVDTLVGWAMSLILRLEFVATGRWHRKHHAHANDPDRDPDMWVAGSLVQTLPNILGSLVLQLLAPLLLVPALGRAAEHLAPALAQVRPELRRIRIRQSFDLVALWAAAGAGHLDTALVAWFLPSMVAYVGIILCFSWLPHAPFDDTRPFKTTRRLQFPLAWLAMLGHHRHLLHHLCPAVPAERLGALEEDLTPLLAAHGVYVPGRDKPAGEPVRVHP